MEELKKNLTQAFDLLSSIPVSGQNVDTMYAARTKLRTAFRLAEEAQKAVIKKAEALPPDQSGKGGK